jgi:hypothetical protein
MMVYMGRIGWRHRETGRVYRGEEFTGGPGADYKPIVQNVDLHFDENPPYSLTVISLWQPYASLLFTVKRNETRGWIWPPKMIGQQIGIHATAKIGAVSPEVDALCCALYGFDWRETLSRSAILGTVVIEASGPAEIMPPESIEDIICGDWSAGRFASRVRTKRDLWAYPIPYSGQQGFWRTDTDKLNAAASRIE